MFIDKETSEIANGCEIEAGTNLYIEVEGLDDMVSGSFVGIMENGDFVITPPLRFDKIRENLVQSEKIIVKYPYQGSILEVETKYIGFVTEPAELVLFEKPVKINRREQRSEKRFICFISVNAELFGKKKNGIIRDISRNGCRCNFVFKEDEEIPVKRIDRIILRCKFPGISEEKEITGEVKNYLIHGTIVTFGILFIDTADDIQKIIDNYILSIEDFS